MPEDGYVGFEPPCGGFLRDRFGVRVMDPLRRVPYFLADVGKDLSCAI